MATDEAYMDFLDNANRDPSNGYPKKAAAAGGGGGGQGELRATEAGVEPPAVVVEAAKEAYYMSDADEPFVPVALAWDKGLPNEEEFAKLVHHWDPPNAAVEIMDPVDWDTQGQYMEIVRAVREAGKGNDVRVYRVPGKKVPRVEYWVVTATGGEDGRLVGVKALAVES